MENQGFVSGPSDFSARFQVIQVDACFSWHLVEWRGSLCGFYYASDSICFLGDFRCVGEPANPFYHRDDALIIAFPLIYLLNRWEVSSVVAG